MAIKTAMIFAIPLLSESPKKNADAKPVKNGEVTKMNEERLLACDNCACAPVCKFSEEFKLVHEAMENLEIHIPTDEPKNAVKIVKLKDIPWISKTQNLHCVHYMRKVGGAR